MKRAVRKHGLMTRLVHMGLAVAVILQLFTSLLMQSPSRTDPGNWLFEIHEISGLTALAFAFLFWIVLVSRRHGTDGAALFPWFSSSRRSVLWQDTKDHLVALRVLSFPAYKDHSPLASAVHGLGLLLMSAMTLSGSLFYLAKLYSVQESAAAQVSLELHHFGGNLAWAYLIGHAGLATIHHFTLSLSLAEMWSLRRQVD